MTPVTRLPNILGVKNLCGENYYKGVEVPRIEKIRNYFWSLRNTVWEKKVKNKLSSTSFLEGVSGTPLVFYVTDFWNHENAPENMRGTWIHKSLLFPFVSMSSTKGLLYRVERFDSFLTENNRLKVELEKMSMELIRKNEHISKLENNTPAPQLELPMPSIKALTFPKTWGKGFPLPAINKVMKMERVLFGKNGPKGKEARREHIYKELILQYLDFVNIAEQKDKFYYTLRQETEDMSPKRYAYTYKPHRQDSARHNENNLPVQYIGLTRLGIKTILKYMAEADIIENVNVIFR